MPELPEGWRREGDDRVYRNDGKAHLQRAISGTWIGYFNAEVIGCHVRDWRMAEWVDEFYPNEKYPEVERDA